MDTHNNYSENSEKSEPGSNIIFTLKAPLKSDRAPTSNDDIKCSTNRPFIHPLRHQEHLYSPRYILPLPTQSSLQNISEKAQLYRERILPRTNSSPNLTNNTITRYNFQTGLRSRVSQHRSLQGVDMKLASDKADGSPPNSTAAWPGTSAEHVQTFTESEPHQVAQGVGVLGMISRLTSIISPRAPNPLDVGVLNNLNMEVGTVASRIDRWTQRLEEEMTNSVRSHSPSFDGASTRRSTPNSLTNDFITGEIHNLVQLIRNLVTSLSGRFTSLGWLGIEDKLMLLLDMGSSILFPVAETLMLNIWRMLRWILALQRDDPEKSDGISSIIETINNAFYVLRSLIHLGKAYQDAHERSDSDYTGEDSRSIFARSLSNLDQKP